MKAFTSTLLFGVAIIVICAIAVVIGFGIQYCIPGCHCDEGAGCHGCGIFGGFIALLTFGGFVVAMATILLGIPLSIFMGFIVFVFGSLRK